MIETKISNAHMKVFAKFGDFAKAAQRELYEELDSIGLDIVNNIKMKMRNTKRQAKSTGTKGHHPSVPGSPPAIDGGRLVNSFETRRIGGVIEVGTNVKYGAYLQQGVKGGTVIKAKNAKILSDGKNFFGKSVVQGAIKPRPFLEPGLEGIDFEQRFADAIARGLKN